MKRITKFYLVNLPKSQNLPKSNPSLPKSKLHVHVVGDGSRAFMPLTNGAGEANKPSRVGISPEEPDVKSIR